MAALALVILAAAVFAEVAPAPWTIDLPEVRKEVFDAHGKNDQQLDGKNANSSEEFNVLYSNYHPNSKYNQENKEYGIRYDDELPYADDAPDMGRYAEDYEYQGYMEKKVTKLVDNGSKYLEGLRRALEQYYISLEACDRMNFTTNSTAQPDPQPNPSADQELTLEKCHNITSKSQQVRRVAELSLHTTKMLQERVHIQKYESPEEYDIEDRALIIRLAWFLDKLAELTGYEADVEHHLTTTSEVPITASTQPPIMTLSAVPEDIKQAMLECLHNRQASPDPATVRCNFPVTYPDFMQQLFNSSDSATASSNSDDYERILEEDTASDFSDISEIHDHNLKEEFPPKLPVKTDVPPKLTDARHVQKRSLPVSDPLNNIVNYYAKYKAWANVNPDLKEREVIKSELLNGNKIEKRSLEHYLKNPEEFQDVEFYVNHKAIMDTDKTIQELKINEKSRKKRYSYYERKTYPRVPEDPMSKLDFYYKNKKGTEYNPNAAQAAEVRAGLERIFQTGNIETIRRYGSNYNPAVRNHIIAGLSQGIIDLFQ